MLYVLLIEKPVLNIELSSNLKQLLMVGFLGALTTYSSFSLEAINLLQAGHTATAITYAITTMLACLGLTALAMMLTRYLV